MHHLSKTKSSTRAISGFTLVEMLVIAPIVILAIGGFIALMVTMVGSVLTTRDQNAMIYQSQDSLSRIEDDIRLAARFLTTTSTLTSPQGSNNNFTGTSAFTNASNTLILSTLATTKNPADATRELVYYKNQPNACDAQKVFNQVYFNTIIYFIKDGSLWRRTVMPNYNTSSTVDAETVCTAPWQQNSCSPGYTSTRCQTNDIELMKNVSSLAVEYYSSASSNTNLGSGNAGAATSIKVTVNGSKNTAGRTVATSQSTRATRLNISIQPPTFLPLGFIQHPSDTSVIHTDTNIQFAASPNYSGATIQWQRSIDSGATWTDISGATSSTYTLATVSLSMTNYRYRAVATYNSETATSNPATLTVTLWGDIEFNSGFSNYLGTYAPIGYTKTTRGVVMLKGLIKKSSAIVSGEVIGTLPVGSRPSGILLFQTSTNSNVASRIDIYPNGDIKVNIGDAGWVSLEGITFIPAGTSYTRNTLTTANGWVNYGGSFSPATYVTDSLGRTHVEGLVRNGTIANGTQMVSNLPASARTDKYMHLPARSTTSGEIGIDQTDGIVAKNAGTNGYMAINSFFYPASMSGSWTNLTLQSGWVSYDGGSFFSPPQYTKGADNIVRLRGLIKGGSTANGTLVANLPAGFRPKDRTLLGSVCNPNVYCRIDVLSNGNVELSLADSAWTSLDSVTFLAEQ
jgi:Tfp pilus assembly protein PilV